MSAAMAARSTTLRVDTTDATGGRGRAPLRSGYGYPTRTSANRRTLLEKERG